MGHTVWSQRIVVDVTLRELRDYGKALSIDDRLIYEKMLKKCYKHMSKISYASSLHAWAFILLSIILEQEKRINKIEVEYASLVYGILEEGESDGKKTFY